MTARERVGLKVRGRPKNRHRSSILILLVSKARLAKSVDRHANVFGNWGGAVPYYAGRLWGNLDWFLGQFDWFP